MPPALLYTMWCGAVAWIFDMNVGFSCALALGAAALASGISYLAAHCYGLLTRELVRKRAGELMDVIAPSSAWKAM